MDRYFSTIALSPICLRNLPLTTKTVLEIGCGIGDLASIIAEQEIDVLAVDNDPIVIAEAKKRHLSQSNLEFKLVRSDNLFESLGDKKFDCIITVFALHHMNIDSILRSMAEHVSDRGKIIIVDFFDNSARSFFNHLLDQLFVSHFREFRAVIKTSRTIGFSGLLRLLLWRLGFAVSSKGRQHMRQDFERGIVISLSDWLLILHENLPDGVTCILMGSVFSYAWEKH